MKILIRKWKSVGIAGADQDVDLMQTTDKAYRIGLFWLDSGGGKTTTHNLIKVCLTGDSSMIEDNWHKYERKSNDEFYEGEGRFDLQVSFDAEIYDFILHLNFVDKSLKFEVAGGLKGHSYNYHVPLEAKPYLKKDFVDLYIFNGEFAKSLVEEDGNRMSKEAEKSINTICQLDHFDKIIESLDTFFQAEKDRSTVKKSDKGQITLIENKIKALKDRKKQLQDEVRKEQKQIVESEKTLEKLKKEKNQFDKKQTKIIEDIKKEEEKEKDLKEAIENNDKELLALLKFPSNISKKIADSYKIFKSNLEKLKIPEHSTKEFFKDLVKEPKCICNEPMTKERQKIIIENSNNYIGSDLTQFLNSMKTDVQINIEDDSGQKSKKIEELTNKVKENNNNLLNTQRNLENLRAQVKDLTGRSLQDIENDIEKERNKILRAEIPIKDFDEMDRDVDQKTRVKDIKSKPAIDALIKDFTQQLGLSSRLRDLDKKIGKLKTLLIRFKNESGSKLKSGLVDEMNSRLTKIITDDPITVKKEGEAIVHSGASEGQTLTLAYIFLSSALEMADEVNQFPFVVDSPAGKIGQQYRQNVAKMISKFPCQYVSLIQGGEREWFGETLNKHSGPDIKVQTILRKCDFYQHYFDNPPTGFVELNNSAWVPGFEFFSKVQGLPEDD